MVLNKARKSLKAVDKASRLKKRMGKIKAEVREKGVRVVVSGEPSVDTVEIDGERSRELEKALNKAFKKVQKKMAKKMRGDLGDFDLPGL
jgi:DNA-binding protein YbaB